MSILLPEISYMIFGHPGEAVRAPRFCKNFPSSSSENPQSLGSEATKQIITALVFWVVHLPGINIILEAIGIQVEYRISFL